MLQLVDNQLAKACRSSAFAGNPLCIRGFEGAGGNLPEGCGDLSTEAY